MITTEQRAQTAEGPPAARVISELERLLREPGCPACSYVEEAERSFFSWLEIESFSVAEVQARIRAGMGMCPVHSRRLIEEIGEGHIMTIIAREALAGARQRVRDESAPPGPCPACEAVGFGMQRARQMVLDGLNDPVQAHLYFEHGGICLVHFLEAAPTLERSTLRALADRLARTLADADSDNADVVTLLGGADRDAGPRGVWRDRLPEPATGEATVEELCERLAVDACPVCLATGQADRRYVRWHIERSAENDPSLRNDPGELCPTHLHDLALADREQAAQAIEHKRVTRIGKLERMLGRLRELPDPGRRGRRATVDELDAIRRELVTTPYCPACNAHDAVESSQLELVGAALGLATVRDRYEGSHGLCVRHALQVRDGQAARLVRRHVDGRLGVLAWEVGETARKYAWAFRHEPSGQEQGGWLRALGQIDGRVFEGGPGPTPVPRGAPEPT